MLIINYWINICFFLSHSSYLNYHIPYKSPSKRDEGLKDKYDGDVSSENPSRSITS